jgi:acyl dehydratase
MSGYFEDLLIGERIELGTHTFTEAAIIAFAREFDPQPFHIDPEAAARSPFGGIIASGWHSASVWMKLMVAWELTDVRERLSRGETPAALGPSPGLQDLRWPEPVRPGDTLHYSSTITAKADWPKRPTWGALATRNEGVNQHGRMVVAFNSRVLVQRRVPLAGSGTTGA